MDRLGEEIAFADPRLGATAPSTRTPAALRNLSALDAHARVDIRRRLLQAMNAQQLTLADDDYHLF